jgi:hypothetical protein
MTFKIDENVLPELRAMLVNDGFTLPSSGYLGCDESFRFAGQLAAQDIFVHFAACMVQELRMMGPQYAVLTESQRDLIFAISATSTRTIIIGQKLVVSA